MALGVLFAIAIARLPLLLASALLLGSALVVLTLVQPIIGLSVALIAGPLGAFENILFADLPLESGQLLFLLVVSAWLGNSLLNRRVTFHKTVLNIPLILFILIASLSLLNAISLAYGLKELVKWLELAIAMVMVVDISINGLMKSPERSIVDRSKHARRTRRVILSVLLIAGLSQAVIGIWQFGLTGEGPEHFLILERFYRAFGTFMQPNPFGGFMGMVASLAIGALIGLCVSWFLSRRHGTKLPVSEFLWFMFVAISAMLATLALLMSWSRGAWLGFAAAMAVLLLFLPRRRWFGLFLLAIALGIGFLVVELDIIPQSFLSRVGTLGSDLQIGDVRGEFLTTENYAVVERLAHWQTGLEMARDNLWTGVGFGNYEPAYPDYALLNWPIPLGHAHNYYINLLAEVGVIGAIGYLLFWAVVFLQVIRILRTKDWNKRGMALGLLAAWTALSVHHLVDKLYVNNMFIFIGVMLGFQQVLDIQDD